jgi:glycosyltransferase involved in cell wall biosynthesis
MTPRVTVVVPCYDHGRFLGQALDSVFAQGYGDFEVVVVDDGSTDPATRAALDALDRPRTRLVRTPNRGLSAARNTGIREARGEFVCCLDADDLLEPDMLAKSVAYLDAHPGVGFVSHWLRAFGDEEWEWTPARCDFPALLDANTVNGAALVRRRVLLEHGLFDESMRDGCEDWDLWITLVSRGVAGAILPEFLFRYRRRNDSMSRRMARGGGNVALYERLARKHADAYRAHLPALFTRRAAVAAGLARHVLELRHEEDRWLGGELAKKREHAAGLRDKAARARAAVRAAAAEDLAARREREIVRLGARVAALVNEKAALRAELADESDARRADDARMRASWSWRITAPLRAVHERLTRWR